MLYISSADTRETQTVLGIFCLNSLYFRNLLYIV